MPRDRAMTPQEYSRRFLTSVTRQLAKVQAMEWLSAHHEMCSNGYCPCGPWESRGARLRLAELLAEYAGFSQVTLNEKPSSPEVWLAEEKTDAKG